MVAEIKKGDTLEQAIAKVNKEIDSRRSYGYRIETLPTTAKVQGLAWTNSIAAWWPSNVQHTIKCKCQEGTDISEVLAVINEPSCKARQIEDPTLRQIAEQSKRKAWDTFNSVGRYGSGKCVCVESSPIKEQCLDANQIIVTGLTRAVLKEMLPLLQPLPLYSGSYESRERGEFSIKGIAIPPGLKNAWIASELGGKPLDIQSEIAIEEKFEEN